MYRKVKITLMSTHKPFWIVCSCVHFQNIDCAMCIMAIVITIAYGIEVHDAVLLTVNMIPTFFTVQEDVSSRH